jgi:hypothetical protein
MSLFSYDGYTGYGGASRLSSYDLFGGGLGYGGYDFAADLRREEQLTAREQLRYLQSKAAGFRRRQVELERFGRFVPAGEWDADCEAWPEKSYTWSVGAFTMEIARGPTHAWNGYVSLPAGYPGSEKSYSFWNEMEPAPPVRELTYGGTKDGIFGADTPGKFGFDHSWGSDRQPMVLTPNTAGNHSRCFYTTAEHAIREVWRLAGYFASLVLDGTLAVAPEWMAQHRESLLRIVEQEMREAEKNRAERQARKVAQEAAEARIREQMRLEDERYAAQQAAAAAKLEKDRLERQAEFRRQAERGILTVSNANTVEKYEAAKWWAEEGPKRAAAEALEHKKKRLPHVKKLLEEIEALRARKAAGETLDPLQGKKIGRRAALEKELAELEKELA